VNLKRPIEDPRNRFSKLIDLDKTRINLSPHIVFVCGGYVNITDTTSNHSIRNMFMNISGTLGEKSEGFKLAENFKYWERGYKDLSEFENDIAAISTLVVIFLESAGALTEFGMFFANSEIRSKLVVIVDNKYHEEESFIKYGLLNPLEGDDQKKVLVFEVDHEDIENVDQKEIQEILADIMDHCEGKDQTEAFDKNKRGHIIFLVLQIVDLFSALTKKELAGYLINIGIEISAKELTSTLYILEQFQLVKQTKKSSQYFYYVPSSLSDRASLHFRGEERDGEKPKRYDSSAIRIQVRDYYEKTSRENPSNRRRVKVIPSISEGTAS